MDFFRFTGLTAIAALLALAGCAKQGQDEMSWARTALERNAQIEIVAADPQSRTFTVRVKDTGELRMVRADEVVAGPSASALAAGAPAGAPPAEPPASAPPPQSADTHAASVPPATAAAGEAATADNAPAAAGSSAEPSPASLTPQAAARDGGRLLEQGPGYSIRAAAAPAAPSIGRVRDSGVTSAAVERRHEPIVCQGARLLHIDNRNLEFDGDAVSAEDGCEIHI